MGTEVSVADAPAERAFGFQNVVGESPLLREALRLASRVASARRTTVLLIGETGTGKELFARGIHYAGISADEPFVAINCAAIPESLLESELFGHERGAFTGAHSRKRGLLELASFGTLFLDEVHHLPRQLQPKLLRALESRRVRRLGGLEEFAIECRVRIGKSQHLGRRSCLARHFILGDYARCGAASHHAYRKVHDRTGGHRILRGVWMRRVPKSGSVRLSCLLVADR